VSLIARCRASRTILLARTFFARFFESELMPPGLPQVQLVIWSLALVASPGLLFPARFAAKYRFMNRHLDQIAHALVVDRLLFVTLTMTAIGVVALVIWDGVFPDRRDARILSVLPLPPRVLIVGRLLALAALAAIFLAGMNAVPTIVYGPVVAAFGGAANALLGVAAHFIATTMAGVFVFSTLIALQGIVLNVGGRRAADRLSVVLQILFVMALLQMIFFMPHVAGLLQTDLEAPWLRWIPAIWFLGVYEVVGGLPASGAATLAAIAVAATAISTVMAVALFVATHGRLIRRAIEARDAGSSSRARRSLQQRVARLLLPNSVTRAVFELTVRTLVRSRSHRLLVAMNVGIALALVVSAIVPLALRQGLAAFDQPVVEILSAPLVVIFFLLIGIRFTIALPVEPQANWIVRLLEPADRNAAMNGVRNALLLLGVLPPAIVAGGAGTILWGPWLAGKHLIFCVAMGWLLVEIVVMRLAKIPFTCTYFPGRSRVTMFWPLYLTGFITYTYTAAAWETDSLTQPARFANTLLVIAIATMMLTIARHRYHLALPGLRFVEEDPATMFEGFHLSEGFAAASEEARKLR
jgi:hypothetical protein